MDKKVLLETMRSQRKRWVDVAAGKRVQILLPTELEVVRHFLKAQDGKASLSCEVEEVKRFTCGWEGITEADILGAAVGASDPVAFDPEVWGLLIEEHLDWVRTVARALLDGIVERQSQREADAKN